jgi:hypothetical protein
MMITTIRLLAGSAMLLMAACATQPPPPFLPKEQRVASAVANAKASPNIAPSGCTIRGTPCTLEQRQAIGDWNGQSASPSPVAAHLFKVLKRAFAVDAADVERQGAALAAVID